MVKCLSVENWSLNSSFLEEIPIFEKKKGKKVQFNNLECYKSTFLFQVLLLLQVVRLSPWRVSGFILEDVYLNELTVCPLSNINSSFSFIIPIHIFFDSKLFFIIFSIWLFSGINRTDSFPNLELHSLKVAFLFRQKWHYSWKWQCIFVRYMTKKWMQPLRAASLSSNSGSCW